MPWQVTSADIATANAAIEAMLEAANTVSILADRKWRGGARLQEQAEKTVQRLYDTSDMLGSMVGKWIDIEMLDELTRKGQ